MTGEPGAKGAPRPSTDGRAQGQDAFGFGELERDAVLAWEAADAGNTRAMVNLGALLAEQGKEGQAEQWYRKAADAGRRDG